MTKRRTETRYALLYETHASPNQTFLRLPQSVQTTMFVLLSIAAVHGNVAN